MNLQALFTSEIFTWIVLPLLIFCARIMDVTIGTMRLIFVSKGLKMIAPILGFFEVIIWLLAIGQIMKHLDNIVCYIAYGLGFATGNYVGIYLEEKMSIGTVLCRIIPKKDSTTLIEALRARCYGVSTVEVEGMTGKTRMVFSVVKRKDVKDVLEIINRLNPDSFVTIEDVRTVRKGYFKAASKGIELPHISLHRKKGK
jgi:uncharacterized protein YebE (UPF0316 family)